MGEHTSAVAVDGANVRFDKKKAYVEHKLSSYVDLSLCKQGVEKAYVDLCKQGVEHTSAVAADGANARFEYGTVNADGRLDLCKQGVKNAYVEHTSAVAADGANVRFEYGTVNADGRLDLCKQDVKNAYVEHTTAVAADNVRQPLIKHYLLGNNLIGEDDDGLAD